MSRTRKRPLQLQKANIKAAVIKKKPARPTKKVSPKSPGQTKVSRLERFFAGLTTLPSQVNSKRFNIRRNRKMTFSRKVGIILFLLGFLFISVPKILNVVFEPKVIAEEIPIKPDSKFESVPSVEKVPTRIIVPSLKIDIPVVRARLVNGYWEVSNTSASFGEGSASPGNKGNTVIFAHAREGLFLPLKNITVGKEVYVLTSNTWFHYKVDEIREVNPNDVYVVKKTDDERLTLYTCSGYFDQKRLVVIAKRTT